MKIINTTVVILALIAACLTGCKSKEQRLEEEARSEATKFWESRVFGKCAGEFGDYFGKREGKIYQFDPIVLAVASKPSSDDLHVDYEWQGETMLMCGKWRAFENGGWTEWQKEKLNWPSPGIADTGRTASIGKVFGKWIVVYVDTNPTSYKPVDCKEVERLHPPP